MPTSSPIHEGTVQWEAKKGKWSKRYLRLREHSLFLAKKDSVSLCLCSAYIEDLIPSKLVQGKDEVQLCSLSNFDGYYVARLHRAPKNFVFAVRSTDNLAMWETPADSVHVFSCDAAEGERWIEKIMLARVRVLCVLFCEPQRMKAKNQPACL